MKNQNTPTLLTNRLLLRQFTTDDMEALFTLLKDEEVNTYLPWFPLKSLEETKEYYIKNYEKEYLRPHGYRYAICLRTDNIPIGYVHVSMDDSYDLGYGLRKEFWHKGIVTEACITVLEQLKKDKIPYVTATHDVKNERSGKVMKQLGMSYQYSYEEHWQPKNIRVTFRMYQVNLDGQNDRVYRKYWNQSDHHLIEKDV